MDDVVFGHEDTETSEVDELEDELSLAGLDATELEYMDADERRFDRQCGISYRSRQVPSDNSKPQHLK